MKEARRLHVQLRIFFATGGAAVTYLQEPFKTSPQESYQDRIHRMDSQSKECY